MHLSIIIVNWNSVGFLRKCLASIEAYPPSIPYEVIVVDGASFDGSAEMVAQEFPSVQFIQSHENLGFSRCNNLGVQHARGDALLFLNPDTEVCSGAFDALLNTLVAKPDAGVIGAKLLNSDGTLQTSCVKAFPSILNEIFGADSLHRLAPKLPLWGLVALYHRTENPAPAQVISGACMLVRRSAFEAVGGFNPAYFMYSEDVELCYSLNKARFVNYYVPTARITHHGGGSSRQQASAFSLAAMRNSRLDYFRHTRGALYAWLFRVVLFLAAVTRVCIATLLTPFFPSQDKILWRNARQKWGIIARWCLQAR